MKRKYIKNIIFMINNEENIVKELEKIFREEKLKRGINE